MSKKENDWDIDLDIPEEPITPVDKDDKHYTSSGWKFYLSVRKHLNDYWQEFNGELDNKGKPKYRNVRKFVDSKFKRSADRDMFYTMICTYQEWELLASVDHGKSATKVIPWLGDWYKRRKNGYWQEDNSIYIKSLRRSIKENLDSSEAIKATAPFLIQEMMRYSKIQSKIEQAFGGQPFLDESPTSPANTKRFALFIDMVSKVSGLKIKLVHEWMRIHGVNPHEPNQMWNMAQLAQQFGQVGAAGALTGAAAGIMLSNPSGAPTLLSRDALLLADNIVSHSKDFGEPKTIDAETQSVKEKPNGKTNGKHVTQ
jgi:hypothetical protein